VFIFCHIDRFSEKKKELISYLRASQLRWFGQSAFWRVL